MQNVGRFDQASVSLGARRFQSSQIIIRNTALFLQKVYTILPEGFLVRLHSENNRYSDDIMIRNVFVLLTL